MGEARPGFWSAGIAHEADVAVSPKHNDPLEERAHDSGSLGSASRGVDDDEEATGKEAVEVAQQDRDEDI